MEIHGCQLECTSDQFPEQYNVHRNGRLIGYIRCRHYEWHANYPSVHGLEVLEGDANANGKFSDPERLDILTSCVLALIETDDAASASSADSSVAKLLQI